MLNVQDARRTTCCILVDKEEIGSVGATGMHSRFFENTLAEIIALTGEYSELRLRRILQNSHMLSSDVSAAFDPNYPQVMEKKNAAYFGKGLVLNKYTGSRGKSTPTLSSLRNSAECSMKIRWHSRLRNSERWMKAAGEPSLIFRLPMLWTSSTVV